VENVNIVMLSALLPIALIICVMIASNQLSKSLKMYLDKKDIWHSFDVNIEKYYALFLRSLEDHKEHFRDFKLSDYELITDNEVTSKEYTSLKKDYIKSYVDKHERSVMFNVMTTHIYSDIKTLTSFLSKDFDVYFKNEYAIMKANNQNK